MTKVLPIENTTHGSDVIREKDSDDNLKTGNHSKKFNMGLPISELGSRVSKLTMIMKIKISLMYHTNQNK